MIFEAIEQLRKDYNDSLDRIVELTKEKNDLKPVIKLYNILKDKLKFKKNQCSIDCELSDYRIIDSCYLFNEILENGKRCQQCIDIFGE